MSPAWPNAFVVGAAKAGTTSLYNYLDEHPDVHMSPVKEPHFFTRTLELEAEDVDEATERYLALFEDAGDARIRGEASPSYLAFPEIVGRIHEEVPDAKIVVILRDPVERAFSHFLFQERKNARLNDFHDAFLRDVGRYHVTPPEDRLEAYFEGELYLFGEMGNYADQIQRYLDVFGEDQIHVILLDDLKTDAEGTLEKLARFLDVDPEPLVDVPAEAHNPYQGPPNRFAKFLQTDPRVKSIARVLMPLSVREWVGNNVLIRPGEKPQMSDETRRMLQDYYDDEIDRLDAVLERDVEALRAGWIDDET